MLLVTVIDPGEGALSRAIASFGKAVVRRIKRKEIRFREIQRTPGELERFSASFRAAKEAGKENVFLESIGLDEKFAKFFEAVPETEVGKATRLEAEVRGRTAEALLETDVFDLSAQNSVLSQILQGRTLTAESVLDLPELGAIARTGESLRTIAESEQQINILARRKELGIDKVVIDQELFGLEVERQGLEISKEARTSYVEYFNGLDPNDPAEAEAINILTLGLTNPAGLQALQNAQRMGIEAKLRLAASQGGNYEAQVDLTVDMEKLMQDAVDRLIKAEGKGNIEQAKIHVNNVADLMDRLSLDGSLLPLVVPRAIGKTGKFEFAFDRPAHGVVGDIMKGADELLRAGVDPALIRERGQTEEAMEGLTSREKDELKLRLQSFGIEPEEEFEFDIRALGVFLPPKAQLGLKAAGEIQALISRVISGVSESLITGLKAVEILRPAGAR